MAVTVEIDSLGVRVVDTAADGPIRGPSLVKSITVTEYNRDRRSVADAASNEALPFGSVTAAKILAIKTDGPVTLKVNAESTGHVINTHALLVDTGGSFTAATVSNASGAAVIVEWFVAG